MNTEEPAWKTKLREELRTALGTNGIENIYVRRRTLDAVLPSMETLLQAAEQRGREEGLKQGRCQRCNGSGIDPENSLPAEGPSYYSMGEPPVIEPCIACQFPYNQGPADYATSVRPDGTTWTDLTRLDDGRVMCTVCSVYTPRTGLTPDPDGSDCVIDVCRPCHAQETGAPMPDSTPVFTWAESVASTGTGPTAIIEVDIHAPGHDDPVPVEIPLSEARILHEMLGDTIREHGAVPDSDGLRSIIDRTIRSVMLIGLQDANLEGPPGTERISEWADWIIAAVTAAVQPQPGNPELRPDDDTLMRFPTSGNIAREELIRIRGITRDYCIRAENAEAALARTSHRPTSGDSAVPGE